MRGVGPGRIARTVWCAACLAAYLLLQAYFANESTEPRSGFGTAFGSLVVVLAVWGLVDAKLKKLRKS
jgi:hypothetical protein